MVRKELVDFKELFAIAHIFYKTIGVSPLFRDVYQSIPVRLFFWLSFINLAVCYVGEWIFMFSSFQGNGGSFLQVTALAPCICFVTIACTEMILVACRRDRLINILTTMEQQFPKRPKEQRSERILEKKRNFNRFMFGFSGAFLVLITTFNFIPVVVTLMDYSTHGIWKKELPYFIWYPFDAFDDRYFSYIYALQTWAGFTCVFAILAGNFLIGSSVLQFGIQFERISRLIRDYRPGRRLRCHDNEFLKRVIEQHNFTIKNADEFANIVSETVFVHHICSSLVICFVGFQVVAGESVVTIIKFLLFLICSLIQTVMMSYFGNQMQDYSSDVGSAVHESDWIDGDVRFRRAVLLVLLRAKKPQCLTGLKYTTVSLRGFTKILGTSYSYFALLRTVYKRM